MTADNSPGKPASTLYPSAKAHGGTLDCALAFGHHNANINAKPVLLAPLLFKAFTDSLELAANPKCPVNMEESQKFEHGLQRCQNFDVLR